MIDNNKILLSKNPCTAILPNPVEKKEEKGIIAFGWCNLEEKVFLI